MKYSELAGVYDKLGSTTKRLEKTFIVAKLLKEAEPDELQILCLLLEGRLFPTWDTREVGVASQIVIKAISLATGIDADKVEKDWKDTGDLGITARNLVGRKKQATLFARELTLSKVFENLRKLAETEGSGSVDRKLQLIAELLTSATESSAVYIVRTVLGQMRVGVGAGSMRDAIIWAFLPPVYGLFYPCEKCMAWSPKPKCLECGESLNADFSPEGIRDAIAAATLEDLKGLGKYSAIIPPDDKQARDYYTHLSGKVQDAYDLCNDFGIVAKTIKTRGLEGLEDIQLTVGAPVKVMLAMKAGTIEEAFGMTGRPSQVEYKYDGFRMQVHMQSGKVRIFTRRLDDVTAQFPDVAKAVGEQVKGESLILDCEAVGFDPKSLRYRPFQDISQRIKRKYEIARVVDELPVELNIFDIICFEGRNLTKEPFADRRRLLERITVQVPRKVVLSKCIITDSDADAKEFFSESKKAGNEGLMFKTLLAPYKPGGRVGFMVKYKEIMDTLDLVITGAEWGQGKRSAWLSSFFLSCRDGPRFLEIGKVGTGIKEKENIGVSFEQLTQLLKPLIKEEDGKLVTIKPAVVVEVSYEEIQQSPTYSSGYALRFPRVVKLREDRGANDCSDISYVEQLFNGQKKRK